MVKITIQAMEFSIYYLLVRGSGWGLEGMMQEITESLNSAVPMESEGRHPWPKYDFEFESPDESSCSCWRIRWSEHDDLRENPMYTLEYHETAKKARAALPQWIQRIIDEMDKYIIAILNFDILRDVNPFALHVRTAKKKRPHKKK